MVEKRLRKFEGLRSEVTPPQYKGDNRPGNASGHLGLQLGSGMAGGGNAAGPGATGGSLAFFPGVASGGEQFLEILQRAKKVDYGGRQCRRSDGQIDPPGNGL